jgi:hypothetical protein
MQSLRILSANYNDGKAVREGTFHPLDIVTNVNLLPFKDVIPVYAIPTNRLRDTCYVLLTINKLNVAADKTFEFRDDNVRTNGVMRLFLKFHLRPRAFLSSFAKSERVQFDVHLLYRGMYMSCGPVSFRFANNNARRNEPVFVAIKPDKTINGDEEIAFIIGHRFRPNMRVYFDDVLAKVCESGKEWCKIVVPTPDELSVGHKSQHVATVRMSSDLGDGKWTFAPQSHKFTYSIRDILPPLAVTMDLFPGLCDAML